MPRGRSKKAKARFEIAKRIREDHLKGHKMSKLNRVDKDDKIIFVYYLLVKMERQGILQEYGENLNIHMLSNVLERLGVRLGNEDIRAIINDHYTNFGGPYKKMGRREFH